MLGFAQEDALGADASKNSVQSCGALPAGGRRMRPRVGAAVTGHRTTGKHARPAAQSWDATAPRSAPLAEAYRHGAADAQLPRGRSRSKSKSRRSGRGSRCRAERWPMLIGLLAAGAAVGAAGALVMRRRQAAAVGRVRPSRPTASTTRRRPGRAVDQARQGRAKVDTADGDKVALGTPTRRWPTRRADADRRIATAASHAQDGHRRRPARQTAGEHAVSNSRPIRRAFSSSSRGQAQRAAVRGLLAQPLRASRTRRKSR